jgi:hypothetical protein
MTNYQVITDCTCDLPNTIYKKVMEKNAPSFENL